MSHIIYLQTIKQNKYDHRIIQSRSRDDRYFGTPVMEPISSSSEFASTNNEEQGTHGTHEMMDDACEQYSTQHHHELEYRP